MCGEGRRMPGRVGAEVIWREGDDVSGEEKKAREEFFLTPVANECSFIPAGDGGFHQLSGRFSRDVRFTIKIPGGTQGV